MDELTRQKLIALIASWRKTGGSMGYSMEEELHHVEGQESARSGCADDLEELLNEPREAAKQTFELFNWNIKGDGKSGEHILPAKVEIEILPSRIMLKPTLPSGITHDIALEMEDGILSLFTWFSSANRSSPSEDKIFTHDQPSISVKLGSDQSAIWIDRHNEDESSSISLDVDHVSGLINVVSNQQADSVVATERIAAANAVPEVGVVAPQPIAAL